MTTLTCAACGEALSPAALHYRFALELEGEQRALDGRAPSTRAELDVLMRELEDGDPAELEAQVHFEASGVLCPRCRGRLMDLLGRSSVGPH